MNKELQVYIGRVLGALDSLEEDRRVILGAGSEFIRDKARNDTSADLIFICTHNSRRSHLAQVWCQIAACHYQLEGLHAWSGGTETTACNIRTIESLRRAGFQIDVPSETENPVYAVRYAVGRDPLWLYSKTYDTTENPRSGFAAMMCCSDVDENCPVIHGSEVRVPLHYRDPKESDGTSDEQETYDRRCFEIAVEMFFMVSRINQ